MSFEQTIENNLPDLAEFIKRQLAENATDPDFWVEFNSQIDVHFSENEDDESENFGTMEIFAYPIVADERNGGIKTDTDTYVQIFIPTGV